MGGNGLIWGAAASVLALLPAVALAQSVQPPALPINDQALSDVLFAPPAAGATPIGPPRRDPFTAAPVGAPVWPPVEAVGFSEAPAAYRSVLPSVSLLRAGPYALNLIPHANFGLNGAGSDAEAGARFEVGARNGSIADRLSAMGVKDGSSYDQKGRWYLFAAVGGRAVGFNMQQDPGGMLRRAGWSTDQASALIGDGQLGLGWRQGKFEASFGYVHRQVKLQAGDDRAVHGWSDSMAGLTVSFHPH